MQPRTALVALLVGVGITVVVGVVLAKATAKLADSMRPTLYPQ